MKVNMHRSEGCIFKESWDYVCPNIQVSWWLYKSQFASEHAVPELLGYCEKHRWWPEQQHSKNRGNFVPYTPESVDPEGDDW